MQDRYAHSGGHDGPYPSRGEGQYQTFPSKFQKIQAARRESKLTDLKDQMSFFNVTEHLASPSTLETRDSILEETKTLHSTSGDFEHRNYIPETTMYQSCMNTTIKPPPSLSHEENTNRLLDVFHAYRDTSIPRKQIISGGFGKFICRPEQIDRLK